MRLPARTWLVCGGLDPEQGLSSHQRHFSPRASCNAGAMTFGRAQRFCLLGRQRCLFLSSLKRADENQVAYLISRIYTCDMGLKWNRRTKVKPNTNLYPAHAFISRLHTCGNVLSESQHRLPRWIVLIPGILWKFKANQQYVYMIMIFLIRIDLVFWGLSAVSFL